MIQKKVVVNNRAGLHTRPAATLVKKASKYKCEFYIDRDGFRVNGQSIIGVMTLAAEQGTELILEFNGPDEFAASEDLFNYFERGFDEAY
jgi:phosphocarrier protein